jgi:hypothetical protein
MALDLSVARRAPASARRMAEAARAWLDLLQPEQLPNCHFAFDTDERYFWHFTPTFRSGLLLRVMSQPQRDAAMALLDTALSERGRRTVRRIISLEPILLEHEATEHWLSPWVRDAEFYYFSVYGEPGGSAPWAWKVGGHHVGVHATLVDGDFVSPMPLFFGCNPSEVRYGPQAGSRTLPEEEDMARGLLGLLDPARRAKAIVSATAPDDILTYNSRYADPNAPLAGGLALSEMDAAARDQLVALLRHYNTRSTDELAAQQWEKVEAAGLDRIVFAWAGPEAKARGNGHYYAIKGPSFLVEYDNTQNEANHIHSVWRDFDGDWGEDLLAAHYRDAHR